MVSLVTIAEVRDKMDLKVKLMMMRVVVVFKRISRLRGARWKCVSTRSW